MLDSIYKYVTQLANAQRRLIDKLAKTKSYSGAQGKVIHYLFTNKDKTIFQKDIERDFGMRAATATELIKSLERLNLVSRMPSEQDGRFKKIVLTEKADGLRKSVSQDMYELEKRMTSGIGENDLQLWINITSRMLNNLKEADI